MRNQTPSNASRKSTPLVASSAALSRSKGMCEAVASFSSCQLPQIPAPSIHEPSVSSMFCPFLSITGRSLSRLNCPVTVNHVKATNYENINQTIPVLDSEDHLHPLCLLHQHICPGCVRRNPRFLEHPPCPPDSPHPDRPAAAHPRGGVALGMGWSIIFLGLGRIIFHRLLGQISLVRLRNYCRSAVSFGRAVPAWVGQAQSCSRQILKKVKRLGNS